MILVLLQYYPCSMLSDDFAMFIPPTTKQFDTKTYTFLQQASYMFRPFSAIIREEYDKEYFPDDGRKGKKLVGGLYDCMYFCIELLGSSWNKHCKIIRMLLHNLTISYFWTDFGDSIFCESLHKSGKQLKFHKY